MSPSGSVTRRPERDSCRAARTRGSASPRTRMCVVGAVAVEVPGEGEPGESAVRVARLAPRRARPASGASSRSRAVARATAVRPGPAHPPQSAVEQVDVVERAAGAELDIDRVGRLAERSGSSRLGIGAPVAVRVAGSPRCRNAGCRRRRAPRRRRPGTMPPRSKASPLTAEESLGVDAAVARGDRGRVVVGERRIALPTRRVERLAEARDRARHTLASRFRPRSRASRSSAHLARGQPVDLLGRAPADVADPELVGAGPDREPERVAQPVGDDPTRVRLVARRRGLSGSGLPVAGSTRITLPPSAGLVAAGAHVLCRAALRPRRSAVSARAYRPAGPRTRSPGCPPGRSRRKL